MRFIVAIISTKYGVSTFIAQKEKIILREIANFCLENSGSSASPIDADMKDSKIVDNYFLGNEEDFIQWDRVKAIKKMSDKYNPKKKNKE